MMPKDSQASRSGLEKKAEGQLSPEGKAQK